MMTSYRIIHHSLPSPVPHLNPQIRLSVLSRPICDLSASDTSQMVIFHQQQVNGLQIMQHPVAWCRSLSGEPRF